MNGYPEEQLLVVANLYYDKDMTQEEIAVRTGLSRVTVTRMLRKARDDGIVRITVQRPLPAPLELGLELERRYGLKAARVVPTGTTPEETLDAVGRAGATLLDRLLRPGCRVGAAWSRTVNSMLPYVRRPSCRPLCVTELAGTYLDPEIPYGVSRSLAEKLDVPLESVPLPVLVRSGHAKKIMVNEPFIRETLKNAAAVDLAFVGIGSLSEDSTIIRSGYIAPDLMEELSAKGAVGDILMRYYDSKGRYIPMAFEDRTVSLEWNTILKLPCVVTLAYGPDKVKAIAGALAGGVLHGLVTDRRTAEALLHADNTK